MSESEWTQFEKECAQAKVAQAAGIDQGTLPATCAKASAVRMELKAKAWVSSKLDLLNLFR
jgi:hypothetical protein